MNNIINQNLKLKKSNIYIAHEIPKRIRFKAFNVNLNSISSIKIIAFFEKIQGVTATRINLLANSVIVNYDNNIETREKIIDGIINCFSDENTERFVYPGEIEQKDLFHISRSIVLLLFLPIMPQTLKNILTFISVSPLLLRGIKKLFLEGIKADVLSALAVLISLLRKNYLAANLTYLLIETGEYLEYFTTNQADKAITKLLNPSIEKIWVERDNNLIEININDIDINDIVSVNAGNIIPIDGTVISGGALVDESSLTGEGIPIKKEINDYALSGSTVREGAIKIRAEKIGIETITARISSYILKSLASKSNIQRYSDKLGDRSVFITLIIASIVYILTRDIKRTASVLLVDYACAIKLSPSVAFKSSMYKATTEGVIIKGGNAFEKLSRANVFVFDKTGTLTSEHMEITDLISFHQDYNENDILAMAASLEEHYNHPVGQAIVRHARQKELKHIKHSDVEYIIAHGLKANVYEKQVLVGSNHFIEEDEDISFDEYDNKIKSFILEGKTLLYMTMDYEPIGIIALKEKLRHDAKDTIIALKKSGAVKVIMLTGDEKNKAMAVSEEIGLDEVYYKLLPEDKSRIIEELKREECNIIAFCGDGINDAPALSIADVSIAVYNASDMAKDVADIVLIKNEIYPVVTAKEIAVDTMDIINKNFNISTGLNSLILLSASTGFIGPLSAAFLHNILTLSTLLNSFLPLKK
jgi:heavy metal translocating P-type ATPase